MNRDELVLTQEDWEIIKSWYYAAAGEGIYCPLREHVVTQEAFDKYYAEMIQTKALLDKLGFEYAYEDSYTLSKHGLIPEEKT